MDVSFSQSDWEELAKATNGTASVLQFIPTSFSRRVLPFTSVSSPTIWEIVSSLDYLCKKDFYNKLSELRNEEIISNIFSLTLQQSNSSAWFCYREGLITASIVHEVIPKLKSKVSLNKNT